MARNTDKKLYNSTIYSVYVRNHSKSGDFDGVTTDLDRIADLGIDTIWLMPIHPIGVKERKGSLGCPYSIKDYRSVNPEYGTLDDFKKLIDGIHSRNMKCIIDVVYNHTSKDSVLAEAHPEYFIRNDKGEVMSKVTDWSDVADFDFDNKELWGELIDTLKYWCSLGVDGFRCDVAPLVPMEFWKKAREEVQAEYPFATFLAESGGLDFVKMIRSDGFDIATDSELFTAFDMLYDYDIRDAYSSLIKDKDYTPADFMQRLNFQNNIYPANANKMRFLENHDNPRSAKIVDDYYTLINYTAMMFFQKGATLLYAGQETMETNTPNLFEVDTISLDIKNQEYYDLLKKLVNIKRDDVYREGFFYTEDCKDKNTVHLCYKYDGNTLNGVFNLRNKDSLLVDIPDGVYQNIINDNDVKITDGKINKNDLPAFFVTEGEKTINIFEDEE